MVYVYRVKPDQILCFIFFPLPLSFMYILGSHSALKKMQLQKAESM